LGTETCCKDAILKIFSGALTLHTIALAKMKNSEKICWKLGSFGTYSINFTYFDGQISKDEWLNLKWKFEHAAIRPNVQAAYCWSKDGYSKKLRSIGNIGRDREGRVVGDLVG